MRLAHAQGPHAELVRPSPKTGWEVWRASDGERAVIVHVRHDARRLPLVVFATGSHCVPVFFTTKGPDGVRDRSTLPFDADHARELGAFQFAVIERKHLESFTEINDVAAADHCTEEHGGVRKEDRAADLALAAAALAAQPWVSSLILAGHSEGADVVTGAVGLAPPHAVAAIGLFAGGGISQFFDEVVVGRRRRDPRESQQAYDELLAMTGTTPPQSYEGFPFARFHSFAITSTALDDLAGRDVPVFVAQGTADSHATIESVDAMVVELLRRDPSRAVRYIVLDGGDHGLIDSNGDAHAEELLAELVAWTADHHVTRSIETRSFERKNAARVRLLHLPPWLLIGLLTGAAAALVVLSRRGGRPRRVVVSVLGIVAAAAAGATCGLWRSVVAGIGDPQAAISIGALVGALASVLALWLGASATAPRSSRR